MSAFAFALLGLAAVVSAALVVLSRHPVISALWLALSFAATAGLFAVLHAEFLAAIQVMVYAGAILVFVLFVIMLLNLTRLPPSDSGPVQRWLGLYLAVLVLVLLGFVVHLTPAAATAGSVAGAGLAGAGNTEALAALLYTRYIFPFELASLLLTAAVVGAWVLAHRRAKGEAK